MWGGHHASALPDEVFNENLGDYVFLGPAEFTFPKILDCIYHKKEIPDKLIVHQICQNNACVNPEHLIVCSKSESRLKYNSTRVHPDAKKLIQNLKVAEGPAL